MKKIILAAMALAALAACSKESTVDVDRAAIAFGQAFVDNSTKAAATVKAIAAIIVITAKP